MAQFLVEVAYTPQAWASLVKSPQDRSQTVQTAVQNLGGKIERVWLSFGEYDAVVMVDMPDTTSAAALSIAFSAGGSCRSVKTTPLLSTEEGMEAMKKAANCGYQPVAKGATA